MATAPGSLRARTSPRPATPAPRAPGNAARRAPPTGDVRDPTCGLLPVLVFVVGHQLGLSQYHSEGVDGSAEVAPYECGLDHLGDRVGSVRHRSHTFRCSLPTEGLSARSKHHMQPIDTGLPRPSSAYRVCCYGNSALPGLFPDGVHTSFLRGSATVNRGHR